MSSAARRQPSTSSLSKYYNRMHQQQQEEDEGSRTMDFCNNFWGPGDAGVDVLFARMRGAMRTMNELGNFWKERAAIEEDYAKRLAKLSKMTLGKDEIGELRACIDTILTETEKQSNHHSNLHQQLKAELESQLTVFASKQSHHKKVYQSVVEKQFKQKQLQESYVTKAREKYEQDCMRINSYTAQSSLVQGKDLEKINLKLEKAQMTVKENERDFANFARAFQDTAVKWETDWKTFCDTCQDLEEDRMDFMRDNMWAYANALSTVCVSDDESCERIRVGLEQVDGEKEMENFVRDFGTGNQIQAPPQFVNFNRADAQTSMHSTLRPANFLRSSHRSSQANTPSPMTPAQALPSESEDEPFVNTAGRGAGNRSGQSSRDPSLTRQPSRGAMQQQQANGVNGKVHSPSGSIGASSSPIRGGISPQPQPQQTQPPQQQQNHNLARKPTHRVPPADPHADPLDPTADTYIKVGANAYRVDPNKDPQQQRPTTAASHHSTYSQSSPSRANGSSSVNAVDDPLARQLEELKSAVNTGTTRRQSTRRSQSAVPGAGAGPSSATPSRRTTMDSGGFGLVAPGSVVAGSSPSPSRNYRNSADMVIGGPPSSTSRSASPNPGSSSAPTAAFMVPKKPVSPSPGTGADLEHVLADYHQSLPGERKSVSLSRAGSRRGSVISTTGPEVQQHRSSHSLSQPTPSPGGHAGVGAHGSRSPSPQPYGLRRSPSPNPGEVMQHSHQHHNSVSSMSMGASLSRPQSISGSGGLQTQQPVVQRSPSPNQVGIALDPSGRVMHDDMAQRYQEQQHQQRQQQPQYSRPGTAGPAQMYNVPPPPPLSAPPPQQQQQQGYNAPQQQQQQQPQQRQASYGYSQQGGYRATSPAPMSAGYHQQQQASTYSQHGHGYGQPQQQYQAPPPQQPPQQQPVYQQPTGYARSQSVAAGGGYYGQQQQQQQQQPQYTGYGQPPQHAQQQSGHPSYNQHRRSPSPAVGHGQGMGQGMGQGAPGQQTDEGHTILFYVQALYDYEATIDEEFSFQAGDIIAVTATPEDGWWSGQLLDENRRQPGRHVFPSNFVRLF